MILDFKNLKYYFLNTNNEKRLQFMYTEFINYDITRVQPIPGIPRTQQGPSGFLRMVDLACQNQENGKIFEPFVLLEDDVKINGKLPDKINIPDDTDILYIGISDWAIKQYKKKIKHPSGEIHDWLSSNGWNHYIPIDDNIVRIFNMVSLHGSIICSIRGLSIFQKCMMEAFYSGLAWDKFSAQIQPYCNIYTFRKPLIYQYGAIGGAEGPTNITFNQNIVDPFPGKYINNSNVSIKTLYSRNMYNNTFVSVVPLTKSNCDYIIIKNTDIDQLNEMKIIPTKIVRVFCGNINHPWDTDYGNMITNEFVEYLENKTDNTFLVENDKDILIEFYKSYKNKYVIVAEWLRNYCTKEHYMLAKKLVYFGWKMIIFPESEEEIKQFYKKIDIIKKDNNLVLCITYDGLDISEIKTDKIKLIFKLDDTDAQNTEIRNKCINSADVIIGPYQYLFSDKKTLDVYPKLKIKENYLIPYSAVNEFYCDIEFNNNPLKTILSSGMVDHRYPLREYIQECAVDKKIDILKHTYVEGHVIINKDYYKYLNKYLCCFTDASAFKYVLLKIFEICSVGCLLLVEDSIQNQLNNLGFYDNVNCIMCNKNNLLEKIDWILNKDNLDTINMMRKKSFELVRNKHNTEVRAKYLNNIFLM